MNYMRIVKMLGVLLVAGILFWGLYFLEIHKEAETPREEPVECQQYLEKETFDICLPSGWEEVAPPEDALVMVSNSEGRLIEFEGQEVEFWSYFSVAQKDLGDKNLAEYVDFIKEALRGAMLSVNFTHQENYLIDNHMAYLIETEAGPEETDFKFLIVLIEGKDNSVWTITFTSIKEIWSEQKDLFYNTAKSFREK